ncbi:DUF6932 family protein [Mycolicibacterium sp. A43C]
MSLPEWGDDNLLPAGRHPGTLDDVYGRFVEDAPHREHRERLFSALVLHSKLVSTYLPGGARIWIDGGFAMRKQAPPHDVDVCVIPNDWTNVDEWSDQQYTDILGLITLQNVIIEHPWPAMVERIQPVGALLDAFLVHENFMDDWHETWSSVKVDGVLIEGQVKGYVEVTL